MTTFQAVKRERMLQSLLNVAASESQRNETKYIFALFALRSDLFLFIKVRVMLRTKNMMRGILMMRMRKI